MLIRDKRFPDLYRLLLPQTKDKTSVSPEQMQKLVSELRSDFDYIFLDCPAASNRGSKIVAGADRAIVVTTPEVSAIRDADRIIGLLETKGSKKMSFYSTGFGSNTVRRGDMMSVEDVSEILAIDLLGVIPLNDEQIVIATNQGEPIVGSDSIAGRAYSNVCRRILGRGYLDPGLYKKRWILSSVHTNSYSIRIKGAVKRV